MQDQKLNSFFDKLLMIVMAIVAFGMLAVAAIPSLRLRAKTALNIGERVVLAQVEGQLYNGGMSVKVLKVKMSDEIMIEVYSLNEDGSPMSVLSKIPLESKRDGSINVKGNVTNLALIDVDKDGRFEIVAPTYDEQLQPHLNAFKYNSDTKSFEKLNVPENSL